MSLDTHCLRSLETVNLVLNTETYALSSFTTKGTRAYDIKNLTVRWGSQRVPMEWYVWTQFNALYRPWQINIGRPCVWSMYGTSPYVMQIYVQPVPDQAYVGECDVYYYPVDLVDDTTIDELVYPFTAPVAYYACYKAKFAEQAYGEADAYKKEYAMKAMEAINAFTAHYQSPFR